MKIWVENNGSEDEALLIQSKGTKYKGKIKDYSTESVHTHKLMRNGAYKSPCPHDFHDYKIFGVKYRQECKDSSHLFEFEAKGADRLFCMTYSNKI
ncbi:hypothetical protein [Metaclostridioides mangenotii]|uniref:hypothetical protein n=1 Tax=Metaclostridioides mangenotii TaxID=1540 RepID=UPI0026ECC4F5|nr:hypothetical protein [Clostridioides mangenotii]